MLLKNPVQVNLFRFISKGEFDCIKVGQTKEWILNNFPNPDYINDMGNDFSIWQYGNIEFHFDGEMLYLIWCDNFHKFNAGKNIDLERWIFKNIRYLTLAKVINILNQNKINFTLVHNENIENVTIRILASNVDLHFDMNEDIDYNNIDTNSLRFSGFGLSHENYRHKLL